ncbi:hypothetical protein Q7A_1413 [Methylophaga nitratireducenticrescens]|uniref:Glycosyl transferase, group 1 n=1 Tax=Methylophaga nitratireducenticrescens TaxID=754476 RepID=I1XIM4_METNJ|nr:glycosyltransferase family 4 protein [Methylophaga nitratireducenticrescens]AFI84243.1 hypothetical protein Q7A_1413 [Methylophaga nitratireducenticrescens]
MDEKLTFRLLACDARHITPYGIGYASDSIAIAMNNPKTKCSILSYFNDMGYDNTLRIPLFTNHLVYTFSRKLLSENRLHNLLTCKLMANLKNNEAVHFWTGCPHKLYVKAKKKNKLILHEAINTHQTSARQILESEYQSLGLGAFEGISESAIVVENQKLSISDYIFCPSPNVTRSMLENGVDPQKLIQTSYGLGEHQRHYPEKNNLQTDGLNGLFVGSGIVRKGIHLLLQYWRDADLSGNLVIIGSIDPAIEHIVKPYRDDPRFEFINFTTDIDQYFKKADVFMLPSLEEGSPLVTYLAIGAGLPCIVSPMGGDGVIRHGIEGYIIEPHDKEGWVSTLLSLAQQPSKRRELSMAAYERSEYFLWHNVGMRRADALMTRIGEKQ